MIQLDQHLHTSSYQLEGDDLEVTLLSLVRFFEDHSANIVATNPRAPPTTVNKRNREMFPLPVVSKGELLAYLRSSVAADAPEIAPLLNSTDSPTVFSYFRLTVGSLNFLFWGGASHPHASRMVSAKLTPNKSRVLSSLYCRVSAFAAKVSSTYLLARTPSSSLPEVYGAHTGRDAPACQLNPELVQFPDKAAALDILQYCSEEVAKLLSDVTPHILPPEEWPEKPPKPRVWAGQADWDRLVLRGLAVGLFEVADDVLAPGGRPVYCGAFAVPKVKRGKDVQRFIINPASNSYVRRLYTDVGKSLFFLGTFLKVLLEPDQVILTSEADLDNCFYLFRIPQVWRKLFVFAKSASVPGHEHPVRICCRAVPMGWVSAVDVIQDAAVCIARRAMNVSVPVTCHHWLGASSWTISILGLPCVRVTLRAVQCRLIGFLNLTSSTAAARALQHLQRRLLSRKRLILLSGRILMGWRGPYAPLLPARQSPSGGSRGSLVAPSLVRISSVLWASFIT